MVVNPNLSERARLILRSIIHNFILTANPIGSRTIAKRLNLGLSSATIRNTMADLEDMGLLSHPHTSAGRVPTDLGYRFYVDDLMAVDNLSEEVKRTIQERLQAVPFEADNLFHEVSGLMAEVSKLLAVIQTPDAAAGILDKIEIVRVASGRVMVVIVIRSGIVNTIMLDIQSRITDVEIASAIQLINQRLSGLRISEIPEKISHRMMGIDARNNAVVRLFVDFPEKIFTSQSSAGMHLDGTRNVLDQPEYSNPEQMKGIIELIDDKDVIVHLLSDRQSGVTVTIGDENKGDRLKELSVITSTYRMGEATGTLGIIGPTRMDYSRLVALVSYTSRLIDAKVNRRNES